MKIPNRILAGLTATAATLVVFAALTGGRLRRAAHRSAAHRARLLRLHLAQLGGLLGDRQQLHQRDRDLDPAGREGEDGRDLRRLLGRARRRRQRHRRADRDHGVHLRRPLLLRRLVRDVSRGHEADPHDGQAGRRHDRQGASGSGRRRTRSRSATRRAARRSRRRRRARPPSAPRPRSSPRRPRPARPAPSCRSRPSVLPAFSGCAVDGETLAAAGASSIDMVDSGGDTIASTSALGGDAASFTVTDDFTAPTVTATGLQRSATTGWKNKAVAVKLSATDGSGGSGVAAISYTLDGGATQTYAGAFTVSAAGSHTIRYWAVDHAGNTARTKTGYVNLDLSAPSSAPGSLRVARTAAVRGSRAQGADRGDGPAAELRHGAGRDPRRLLDGQDAGEGDPDRRGGQQGKDRLPEAPDHPQEGQRTRSARWRPMRPATRRRAPARRSSRSASRRRPKPPLFLPTSARHA